MDKKTFVLDAETVKLITKLAAKLNGGRIPAGSIASDVQRIVAKRSGSTVPRRKK